MSAFVVHKHHIDALVTAGLWAGQDCGHRSPLSWFERELEPEEEREGYQEGDPWGPGAIELAQQLRRELTPETAGRVGAMLWAENRRSVNHRYAEDEWEEPYVFEKLPGTPDPLLVLRAISCYEYQSCEHPGWRRSEAHAFVRALEAAMIRRLPGYDSYEGSWDISRRDVFVAKRATPDPVPTAPAPRPTRFRAGQEVSTGPGDYSWSFRVVRRTAKFVTLKDLATGDVYRVGIHESDGAEWALPFGRYSMAPVVRP